MRIFPPSIALAVVGIVAAAGSARGADGPLLVAVEVAPGVDVGPADVRHAVAAELGKAVVATRETAADDAPDVLLVALGQREIRMSLRAGNAPIVSRTIAAPPDRPGRLRSISWLAGNLVRDQVGPIVATAEAPHALAAVAAVAATEPPPVPSAPPPAASAPPAVPSAPAAVAASRSAMATGAIPHAVWSIAAFGGPAVTVFHDDVTGDTGATRSGAFQLEVQRQRSPGSLLWGIALTLGPEEPRHYVGAAVFAGEAWPGPSWFTEVTLGVGLEAIDGFARIGMQTGTAPTADSPSMVTSFSESRVSVGPVPGLFLRAAGTGGIHLSRFFDLVAQLGVHLSSDIYTSSYLSSTIGVRLRLP